MATVRHNGPVESAVFVLRQALGISQVSVTGRLAVSVPLQPGAVSHSLAQQLLLRQSHNTIMPGVLKKNLYQAPTVNSSILEEENAIFVNGHTH
jgi:hypothetical protein